MIPVATLGARRSTACAKGRPRRSGRDPTAALCKTVALIFEQSCMTFILRAQHLVLEVV